MRIIAIALCLVLANIGPLNAQDIDRFTVTGQVRHRSEIDARDFNTSRDNSRYHLLRTRVGLAVAASPNVTAFIEAQDARVFGSEDRTKGRGTLDGSAPALDLHQAYFNIENLFNSSFDIRVGRQEIAFGNQRLIGSVGWSNIGRSFDAGVLSIANEKNSLDIFAAQLVGSVGESAGQNLYGVYGTLKPQTTHMLDGFLFIDDNTSPLLDGPDAGERMMTRFTAGTYAHGATGQLNYELELIYQGGKKSASDSTALMDIQAYLISAALKYDFGTESGLNAGLQYTILSGDDNDADNDSKAFNTLFATNHKFYGFMDFFPGLLGGQGLKDLSGSLAVKPGDKLGLKVEVHYFEAMEARAGGGNKFGQEIDLTTSFKYNNQFSLQSGLSVFFPGERMEAVRGDEAAAWFYIMSTVNF